MMFDLCQRSAVEIVESLLSLLPSWIDPKESVVSAQRPNWLRSYSTRRALTKARTLLVLLNTFSLVLLTAQKLAAVGQPEEPSETFFLLPNISEQKIVLLLPI